MPKGKHRLLEIKMVRSGQQFWAMVSDARTYLLNSNEKNPE